MKYSFDLDNVMRILFYNSAHLTWIKSYNNSYYLMVVVIHF